MGEGAQGGRGVEGRASADGRAAQKARRLRGEEKPTQRCRLGREHFSALIEGGERGGGWRESGG